MTSKAVLPRNASGKTGASKTSGNYTTRDQAAGLRRLLGNIGPRVLPVAGGADGGERAGVAVELANAATAQGYSVVVLDQTRGQVARILGLRPRYDLQHLLSGEKQFEEVAVETASGIRLLPASRGIAELAGQPEHATSFYHAFARLERPANLVIFNIEDPLTAAELMPCVDAEVLLVANASAASITGAYTHVKQMVHARGIANFRVLIGGVIDEVESRLAFEKLAATAGRFLRARLELGGMVPGVGHAASGRKTGDRAGAGNAYQHLIAGLPAWNLFESSANAATH
jgi:flagellar biosynthesis protein FlhG